jgi:hypothetical protein
VKGVCLHTGFWNTLHAFRNKLGNCTPISYYEICQPIIDIKLFMFFLDAAKNWMDENKLVLQSQKGHGAEDDDFTQTDKGELLILMLAYD